MTFTEICSTSTFKNSNKGSLELIKNHPFLPSWPEAQHLTGSELTFTPIASPLALTHYGKRVCPAPQCHLYHSRRDAGMNENDPMLAEQGEGGSQNL